MVSKALLDKLTDLNMVIHSEAMAEESIAAAKAMEIDDEGKPRLSQNPIVTTFPAFDAVVTAAGEREYMMEQVYARLEKSMDQVSPACHNCDFVNQRSERLEYERSEMISYSCGKPTHKMCPDQSERIIYENNYLRQKDEFLKAKEELKQVEELIELEKIAEIETKDPAFGSW